MKLKIISDGTDSGTKLIDEETGQIVNGISKLTWEADAESFATKVTIELTNVPIEVICKANIDVYKFQPPNWNILYLNSLKKEIRVELKDYDGKIDVTPYVKIFDTETNLSIDAVQKITWKATPKGSMARIKKIQ